MGQVIPFAFDDHLVRVIQQDDEPWFVGRDVCEVLGLAKTDTAIARLDNDEKVPHTVGTPGGPQEMIIISEAGVYRLVFTSRKPEAEAFKRWLAHEVLPALRKTGKFAHVEIPEPLPAPGADSAQALNNWRLAAVKEARLLFGNARAARLWEELGLPRVPVEPAADAAARECLDILLEATHFDADCGQPLREFARVVIASEDEDAAAALAKMGVRLVFEGEQGMLVANCWAEIERAYRGTRWGLMRWKDALRRIPSVRAHDVATRFGRDTHRCTFVPLALMLAP